MKNCLKRKGVKSNPPLSPEDTDKVKECLDEIKLMFESQRAKDERCQEENRRVRECMLACAVATTDGVLPTAASGCGEKPSTQTN